MEEEDSDIEIVIANSLVKRPENTKIQVKQEDQTLKSDTKMREPLCKEVSQPIDKRSVATGRNNSKAKPIEASKGLAEKKGTVLPGKPSLKPLSTLVPVVIVPAKTKSIKGRSNQSISSTSTDIKLPSSFRQRSLKSTHHGPLLQKSLDNLNMAKEGFMSAKDLLGPRRASNNLRKISKNQSAKPAGLGIPAITITKPLNDVSADSGKSAVEEYKPKDPPLGVFDDIEEFATDFGDGADMVPELSASQSKALDSLLSNDGCDDIYDLFKIDQQQPINQWQEGQKPDSSSNILTARRPSVQQAKKSEVIPAYSAEEEMDAVLSFGQFAYL
jgi:hypothetical protein